MYEKYLEQLEEAGKIRNLKERSINCYKNYVSYFLKYQAKRPEELTCQDVRMFLLAKKEEGLKTTTLNLYNSAIRFFYRNALHILWDDITVPHMILERLTGKKVLYMNKPTVQDIFQRFYPAVKNFLIVFLFKSAYNILSLKKFQKAFSVWSQPVGYAVTTNRIDSSESNENALIGPCFGKVLYYF